jgi:hypothetical protein
MCKKNYRRVQDALKKRRYVLRSPGPWTGFMVYTDDSVAGVQELVSRKKWAKAKRLLATLHGLVLASYWVDHKVLEIIRGFLVYVTRTYRPPVHYGTTHVHRWLEARKGC